MERQAQPNVMPNGDNMIGDSASCGRIGSHLNGFFLGGRTEPVPQDYSDNAVVARRAMPAYPRLTAVS